MISDTSTNHNDPNEMQTLITNTLNSIVLKGTEVIQSDINQHCTSDTLRTCDRYSLYMDSVTVRILLINFNKQVKKAIK